jgi:hypothetical protein
MTVADWIQLGVIAVAGLGIAMSLRSVRDRLWLQTFSDYTKRYDDILDRLPEEARLLEESLNPDDLTAVERRRLLIGFRRYFNLCSEEFYLRKRRRIDVETWGIWEKGIRQTMRFPTFRRAWETIGVEYAYFADFRAFMQGVVDSDGTDQKRLPVISTR